MQRICEKDHGCTKCPSVVPFEILHSKGPFEVASFERFRLERPFNMAAMIVFTPNCPPKGDISRLECTGCCRYSCSSVEKMVDIVQLSEGGNMVIWDSPSAVMGGA